MNDLSNAILLTLAWFATINAGLSILAWGLGTIGLRRVTRPGWLIAIRLLPAAGSAVFALCLFAPAHWRYEPRGTDESFGLGLHLLALAGAALLARAAWRLSRALRAAGDLRVSTALPRLAAAPDAEVYEVAGLTSISLAGVLRPRILVGDAARRVLTPREFEAAVAHEVAHGRFYDNWTRLAIACAPDLLGHSRTARAIERRWSALAECRADARAAGGDSARAAELASALIKVARLGVSGTPPPVWSTLHDEPLLAERVQRLVSGAVPPTPRPAGPGTSMIWTLGLAALTAAGVWTGGALHQLTETVAHLLP